MSCLPGTEPRRTGWMIHLPALLLSAILLTVIVSCSGDDEVIPPFAATPYTLEIPSHFPNTLNIPSDNPLTVEGIRLGRMLFYDGRLSGRTHPDSLMSCATCHVQQHGFECGTENPQFPGGHPRGLTGIPTPHTMLPLVNLVWAGSGYLWNGSVHNGNPPDYRNLEDFTWMAIMAPHELSGDTNKTRALFQNIPGYPELFYKAFGSSTVTVKNMGRAIAQFVRTLVSADSKFDRYLRGEVSLNSSERNGYVLFMTETGADCFHCHGGDGNPLFTTNLFYNNAKDSVFTDPLDRHSVTGDPADIGAYKAPTLRNIAYTAPYMHDGRYTTLDQVLDFYNDHLVWSPYASSLMHKLTTGGARLMPSDKADLKAFLLTLSDESFITNPDFSRPDSIPGTY